MDLFHEKMLRPDSKGRIMLGKLAKGVSGFKVSTDENHRIILEPYTEIPQRERWLYDNPELLAKVKKGLKQASKEKGIDLGDFTSYIEKDK